MVDIKRTLMGRLSACCLCSLLLGGTAAAFTAIEIESLNARIEQVALTPTGTPWAVITILEDDAREPVRYLRYWDGETFRRPDCRGAHHPLPETAPVKVTAPILFSSSQTAVAGRAINPRHASPTSLMADRRCVFEGQDVCITGRTFHVALVGGGDRDVWAIMQPLSGIESPGRLMKLGASGIDSCEVVPTANWSSAVSASMHITRDGRVIYWGPSFLAVRSTNGVWRRSAAVLPTSWRGDSGAAVVIERGDSVWLFVSPMLYRVDADGTTTGRLVPNTPVADRNVVAHRWGNDRIVVWNSAYPPRATCFNIESLVPEPWPAFPAAWDVRDSPSFFKRDGTVWLTKYMDQTVVVAVPPETGRPFVIPGVPFPHPLLDSGNGQTALECADGTIVSGEEGLTLIAPDHTVKRFGWQYGLAKLSTDFQQTPDGRLWFLNDRRIISFDPSREPKPLPGADCWEELTVIADGPDGVRVTGTNHPARTGGFFRYPRRTAHALYGGEVQRLFEGMSLPVTLGGTPLAGETLMRLDEEESGCLVFLAARHVSPFEADDGEIGLRSENARSFRYKPPCGVAAAVPPPDICGRVLDVTLNPGAAWQQRVHLARSGTGVWQRIPPSRAPVAQFRFPAAGSQRCEVIAFDYGGRMPGTVTFTVKAAFDLPETLRTDGGASDDIVNVNIQPWYPPVRAIPTSESQTLRLVWRRVDDDVWRPLEPGTALSIAAIGLGEQTLLFSAEENDFWRDLSPLRLPVRVTLPLDAYLMALQQELAAYPVPDWAMRALRDCGTDARARLDELAEQARRGKQIEEVLRRLDNWRKGDRP